MKKTGKVQIKDELLSIGAVVSLSASALHAATVDGTYRIFVPDRVQDSTVWWALRDSAR